MAPLVTAEQPATIAPPPRATSRRGFLKMIIGSAAVPLAAGAYMWHVEPFWVEYHDVAMPVRNLPPSMDGMRLAHLTDLHAGETVPFDFLERVVARVKADRPDAVLITGDLATDAQQEWFDPVVDLLTGFKCPTYVSLGNHDYGVYYPTAGDPVMRKASGELGAFKWSADVLEQKLSARGAIVLRNRGVSLNRSDGRLWIVGLEDLWGGKFLPARAFAGVNPGGGGPVIVLSHNPDTALKLDALGPQWIICGHTHGGQVRVPLLGAPILPLMHKEFDQGLFQLPHSRMYVSRGIGFLKRMRFLCRPEVPTYVLRRVS